MQITRPLTVLLVLTALLGGTAFAQQSRNQGRTRQRPNQSSTRIPYGGIFSFQARSLPAEYSLLLTRTIFARSHRSADQPQRNNTARDNAPVRRSSEIVFRGAMREGTRFLAGIENTGSHRTLWIFEGQDVPNNSTKVTEIALDHLIVEQHGVRRIVQIGESVEAGERIVGPTTLPAIANVIRPLTD